LITKSIGENDIYGQIWYENTCRPNVREEKQELLDAWNIMNGFYEVLFEYCKIDFKELRDFCRKWLGVRKKDDIKMLIRDQELECEYGN
jgi:hypothetical protein